MKNPFRTLVPLALYTMANLPMQAHAQAVVYVCVDELGYTYRLRQPLSALLAKFTCTAEPAVDAPTAAEDRGAAPKRGADDPTLAAIRASVARSVLSGEPRPRVRSATAYDDVIEAKAQQFEHDPLLLKAIIQVESAFNHRAVSHKGAMGLMQIMPTTGERFGVDDPKRDLFGPATNIHVGAKYLRVLRDMFGDRLDLAVAAYNAGENAVLRHGRRIPPYPETQEYVRRVLSAYESYRQTAKR